MKKNAVDLTDLAIGIVVLGIVVTIGATILLNVRDNTLTGLPVVTTVNESIDISSGGIDTFANKWFIGVSSCLNSSNAVNIAADNYTITTDSTFGIGTITNITVGPEVDAAWKCTYTSYNTSSPDWALPDAAAIGIAEYGNWFDIIVIVGIAGLILSLIFMAFGRRDGGEGSVAY